MIDTPTPDALQPYCDQKRPPIGGRIRRVTLIPPAVSLLRPDTLPLAIVDLSEMEQQQVELAPEALTQVDQRQTVTTMAGGVAITGIGEILSTALRYAGSVAMTHILSQAAYGIFIGVLSAVAFAAYIANIGLNTTILRFLSIYDAKSESGLAAGLIRFVVRVTLVLGLLCGTVFFLASTFLARLVYHSDGYGLPLKVMALLIPLTALQLVLTSGLQALKAVKSRVYVDRLIQPGLTLILMGAFYLLGLRLEAVILATVCGYLAATIAGQFLLGRAAKPLVRGAVPKFERKTWLHFALPMVFYSIVQNISGNIDILSLTAFTVPAQVGLYGAADRVSGLVLMPFTALSVVFFPLITEYHVRGEHEQLAKMLKLVTKWALSLSLPVFLCFCVFHDAILSIFSREYTAGGIVLVTVSLGNLAYVVATPALILLLALGRTRLLLVNTLVGIVVNVAIAFVLVPRFYSIGAAVAVTTSLIISSVVSIAEVYWIMKIHPFRWDVLKPIIAGGIAAIASFVLLHVLPLSNDRLGTIEALGLIIPFVLMYILGFALLGLGEEDTMVFDVIRTKLGKFARHKG